MHRDGTFRDPGGEAIDHARAAVNHATTALGDKREALRWLRRWALLQLQRGTEDRLAEPTRF